MTGTHFDPPDQELIPDARHQAVLAVVDQIRAGLANREPLAPFMSAICDFCHGLQPHTAWSMAKRIDYESDQSHLRTWFERVVAEDPPATDVNAIYFGMLELLPDLGPSARDLYVAGSTTFGTNDEWVCDLPWWPRSRYAGSKTLGDITRLFRSFPDTPSLLDYALPLAHAATVVSLVLEEAMRDGLRSADLRAAVLHGHDRVPVAVGFDDGDIFIVGAIVPQGFERGEFEPW